MFLVGAMLLKIENKTPLLYGNIIIDIYILTEFALTVLNSTFCNSRNTNLKYWEYCDSALQPGQHH